MTQNTFNKPMKALLVSLAALLVCTGSALAKPVPSVLEVPEDAGLLGDYLAGTYANFLDDA